MAATQKHYKIRIKIKRAINFLWLGLLVIGPIVLLILPKDFFDSGETVCLSVLLFHTQCYACGMTRAIMHLIHFDFIKAWDYNHIAFIVFPLLCFQMIKEFFRLKKLLFSPQRVSAETR